VHVRAIEAGEEAEESSLMTPSKARIPLYISGVVVMFFSLALLLLTAGFAYWRNSEGWDSTREMLISLLKYGSVGIAFAVTLVCCAILVRRSLSQKIVMRH
jgi:hypothetical protein